MNATFIANWAETGDYSVAQEDYQVAHTQTGNSQIQVIRSTVSGGWSDIVTLFHSLISSAQHSIKITTACFVCDQSMIEVFSSALARRVKVEVLLTGENTDQELSRIAGQGRFSELLEAGATICQYQKTILHAKIILIDDVLSCVRSPNFNQRSMGKDEEIALCIIDHELNKTTSEHFVEDMHNTEQYDLVRWKNRSTWQRLKEWFMSFFRKQF